MEEKKTIQLVISGLSHYLDNYDQYCEQLPVGTNVIFVHEPQNPYTPKVAFQARIGRKQVGWASKNDNFKLLPLVDKLGFVHGKVVSAYHKEIHAEVEVPAGICIPETLEEAIGTTEMEVSVLKSCTLVLPESQIQQTMLLNDLLMTFADDPQLPSLLNEWLTFAKRSITAETMQACNDLHERFGDAADNIFQWYKDLGKDELNVPYEAWRMQMDDARVVMQKLDYRKQWSRILWDGATPSQQMLEESRQKLTEWLQALPNDLWALYHLDPKELARHVMYAKFAREHIYIIISHMLALEWVEEQLEAFAPKHRGTDMSGWTVSQIDEKMLFTRHRCEELIDIQQNLFKLLPEIKRQDEYGLLLIALEKKKLIESAHYFTPLIHTLVVWGLIAKADEKKITESVKKSVPKYEAELKRAEKSCLDNPVLEKLERMVALLPE